MFLSSTEAFTKQRRGMGLLFFYVSGGKVSDGLFVRVEIRGGRCILCSPQHKIKVPHLTDLSFQVHVGNGKDELPRA